MANPHWRRQDLMCRACLMNFTYITHIEGKWHQQETSGQPGLNQPGYGVLDINKYSGRPSGLGPDKLNDF